MDIKILDSWLRDYLDTKASPTEIAKDLSLCGPSIEKVTEFGSKDSVYAIEVTTNRIDTASVYGIAREASVILPRFKIPAKLKKINSQDNKYKFVKTVNYLEATVDSKLCPRFTAVLIKGVTISESPDDIKDRLESADVRPINNVVDISNYIMLALGQPVHTFDYDKIKNSKMILRESKKGEKVTTLDNKTFTLAGGDIVIEDGEGRLIDLAGVMGGNLSMVDENTKNVLLFVQTYNPANIRKTSMGLAQRTTAATIFEKGTDPELVSTGILEGVKHFEKLTGGTAEKEILDIYQIPYKAKSVTTSLESIEKSLGITLSKKEISDILSSLEFEPIWSGNTLKVIVPSFRSRDVGIEEDILEEIARIYGYHNLPSELMKGNLPKVASSNQFKSEKYIKDILSGWGGVEVYTLSLVPKEYTTGNALNLKNPLGSESEYLRTSMLPSLVAAAKENVGTFDKFHLFEMANVYLPRKNNLPIEQLMLAGIFESYDFRFAKGIIEGLLNKLNIEASFEVQENLGLAAGKSISVISNGKEIGKLGFVENSKLIYYEFEVSKLILNKVPKKYVDIPKYPPQIEDITLVLPEKTLIGNVVKAIKEADRSVENVELTVVYKDAYTFRIWYQDPNKTLTDSEVEKVRNEILKEVKTKFGGQLKS